MSDIADYMMELVKANGVACATVSDGHVLMFDREYLKKLIERENSEQVIIFVKRPEMKDVS